MKRLIFSIIVSVVGLLVSIDSCGQEFPKRLSYDVDDKTIVPYTSSQDRRLWIFFKTSLEESAHADDLFLNIEPGCIIGHARLMEKTKGSWTIRILRDQVNDARLNPIFPKDYDTFVLKFAKKGSSGEVSKIIPIKQ